MNFRLMITRKSFYLLCFLFCLSFKPLAQDDDGFIEIRFETRTYNEKTTVDAADITILADNKEIQKLKTDKKGNAKTELKYGPKYKIFFSKVGLVTSYMTLSTDIPQKRRITISKFAQSVFFISKSETIIDTVRFRHAFTKWYYDREDNRFKENVDYLKEFETGIFKEDAFAKEAATKEAAKQATEKQLKEKAEKEKQGALNQKHAALRAEFKKQRKIAGKIISVGKTQKPVVGAKVVLLNANKEQIGATLTNELGGFAFVKDGNGDVNIMVEDVNAKYLANGKQIAITNSAGKEVKTSLTDSKGKFNFRFLPAEEKLLTELVVNDADLKTDVQGQILKSVENKQQPLANLKVKYVDELGNVVVEVVTDTQGKFRFKSLVNDAFYLFNIDESDVQLKAGEKIVLADSKGKIVKEIFKDGASKAFNFEIINSDQNNLTTIFYDDPWLKVIDPSRAGSDQQKELVIKEKVYFSSNDATLLPEAKRAMDEVTNVMELVPNITVELSSHSDSKGSDEYNLILSKKRAKAAVDYIVSQGISSGRITGVGYGETKLLNKCANNVDCTEEQHAENRRLEFKVIRN
jgi:outer membrane protein OmpA-like peptidoglycan-associated protein